MLNMHPLLSLRFLLLSLMCTVSARAYYSNSTNTQSGHTASSPAPTFSTSTSTTSDGLARYIEQGLGVDATRIIIGSSPSSSPGVHAQEARSTTTATNGTNVRPVICGLVQPDQVNASYCTATSASTYALFNAAFTTTPTASTATAHMSSAMACWSSIATWRNSSAIWWNSNIASRTWSRTMSWSSKATSWYETTTVYPSSVSTYKLCDGSPRADVRPKTEHLTRTTTLFGTFSSTLMPTFTPQPCSLKPNDCRILYHDTDIVSINDLELLTQCGNPSHLDEDSQCLLGGGPVELIYFPVQSDNSTLCPSSNNLTTTAPLSGPVSARPLVPGLSEITTLGHTFVSESVYISFKTLFASYDGFWDKIGPTFTDYIVPLHSTDISTHCGGWNAAYGTGTPLNYANLNWPVPASAYKCQSRCPPKLGTTPYLDGNVILMGGDVETAGPECNTIWSDINPVLAVPTKVREMVPEWRTCSFWNENIANFWFDPPLAVTVASVAATATMPDDAPVASPASPASEITQPGPSETGGAGEMTSTSRTTSTADPVQTSAPEEDGRQESAQDSSDAATPTKSATDEVNDPHDTTTTAMASEPLVTNPAHSSWTFSYDPQPSVSEEAEQSDATPFASNAAPSPGASLPAFSVLTEALSSFDGVSIPPLSKSGDETTFAPSAIETGVVLTLLSETLTAIQQPSGGGYVLGSTTLRTGEAATMSGEVVSVYPGGGIVIGESTIAVSALPTSPGVGSVIAQGNLTLTASAVFDHSAVVVIDGATLSPGGTVAVISGKTLTAGSAGVAIISGSTAIPLTQVPVTTASSTGEAVVFTAPSLTLTASPIPGNPDALSIYDTTLSRGGNAVTVTDSSTTQTLTSGSSGLEIIGESTTIALSSVAGTRNGTLTSMTLPPVVTSSDDADDWPTMSRVPEVVEAGASVKGLDVRWIWIWIGMVVYLLSIGV